MVGSRVGSGVGDVILEAVGGKLGRSVGSPVSPKVALPDASIDGALLVARPKSLSGDAVGDTGLWRYAVGLVLDGADSSESLSPLVIESSNAETGGDNVG